MQRKTPSHALAITAVALLGLLGSLQQLSATVVVYEGFNYGNDPLASLSGVAATGTGLTGNWAVSASPSTPMSYITTGLTFGPYFLATSGGAGQITPSTANASLAGAQMGGIGAPVTGTLWNSYLIQWGAGSPVVGDQTTVRTNGTAASSSSPHFLSQARGAKGGTLEGDPAIGYGGSSANPPPNSFSYLANTTYLILSQYTNVGTALSAGTPGNATLWVFDLTSYNDWVFAGANEGNLDSFSLFKTTDGPITSGSQSFTSSMFLQFVRGVNGSNPTPNASIYDEVRYHTALSDIVVPVPEPGSVGLLLGGIGIVTLCAVRRRRSFRKNNG